MRLKLQFGVCRFCIAQNRENFDLQRSLPISFQKLRMIAEETLLILSMDIPEKRREKISCKKYYPQIFIQSL
uniref:Uncharacterized protein n=1 Tax=Romanomermis culicivorax TaxID=13658 RepID=A0A915ISD8_ROMCU